jgi:predicted transglutaminase-like cysteine proteinase
MIDVFDTFNRVKDGFTYVSDMEQHGTKEDWRFSENVDNFEGDCDDFAIACRMLLKEKGHECRLIYCKTENGGGHLICVIGKMALDNRMKFPVEIKYLHQHGYEFISASGLAPGDDWRKIDMMK